MDILENNSNMPCQKLLKVGKKTNWRFSLWVEYFPPWSFLRIIFHANIILLSCPTAKYSRQTDLFCSERSDTFSHSPSGSIHQFLFSNGSSGIWSLTLPSNKGCSTFAARHSCLLLFQVIFYICSALQPPGLQIFTLLFCPTPGHRPDLLHSMDLPFVRFLTSNPCTFAGLCLPIHPFTVCFSKFLFQEFLLKLCICFIEICVPVFDCLTISPSARWF